MTTCTRTCDPSPTKNPPENGCPSGYLCEALRNTPIGICWRDRILGLRAECGPTLGDCDADLDHICIQLDKGQDKSYCRKFCSLNTDCATGETCRTFTTASGITAKICHPPAPTP